MITATQELLRSRVTSAGRVMSGNWLVPVALLLIIGTMSAIEPRFFGRPNLLNILRNFSLSAVVAIGQMFVIMVGGFDMAIGACAALASVSAAATMLTLASIPSVPEAGMVIAGVAAGLGAGTLLGFFSGAIVVILEVTPFMATFAVAATTMGIILYLTKGAPIYGLPDAFAETLGRSFLLGLPALFWICTVFVLVCWFAFTVTPFGQRLKAVGGNERAAIAAGIKAGAFKFACYGISGFSGALVGVLLTARIGSGDASFGASTPMESIAAAVLGGTALGGGVGRIGRVLGAVLLLAIVANALNLARIDSKWQALMLGVILIVAMVMDRD